MADIDIFHVAAMPPVEASPELIDRVALIVSQPGYQIRMRLAGRLPKIIGHFHDEAASAMAIQNLRAIGLAAFSIRESELRRVVFPELIAHSLKAEGDSTLFTSREGKTSTVNRADAFLILTGRRTRAIGESAIETSKMTVNVPATLLTGGIPVMKRVVAKNQEPKKITEQFIRLYLKKADVPAVEIRQFDFDYSFLGEKMGLTATGNVDATVTALRQFFDGAYFNNALLSGFVAESKSISGIDLGEQNCLLLVRHYRSLI